MLDTIHLFYDKEIDIEIVEISAPHCVTLKLESYEKGQHLYFHFRTVSDFDEFMTRLNERVCVFLNEGGEVHGSVAAP